MVGGVDGGEAEAGESLEARGGARGADTVSGAGGRRGVAARGARSIVGGGGSAEIHGDTADAATGLQEGAGAGNGLRLRSSRVCADRGERRGEACRTSAVPFVTHLGADATKTAERRRQQVIRPTHRARSSRRGRKATEDDGGLAQDLR